MKTNTHYTLYHTHLISFHSHHHHHILGDDKYISVCVCVCLFVWKKKRRMLESERERVKSFCELPILMMMVVVVVVVHYDNFLVSSVKFCCRLCFSFHFTILLSFCFLLQNNEKNDQKSNNETG